MTLAPVPAIAVVRLAGRSDHPESEQDGGARGPHIATMAQGDEARLNRRRG